MGRKAKDIDWYQDKYNIFMTFKRRVIFMENNDTSYAIN